MYLRNPNKNFNFNDAWEGTALNRCVNNSLLTVGHYVVEYDATVWHMEGSIHLNHSVYGSFPSITYRAGPSTGSPSVKGPYILSTTAY